MTTALGFPDDDDHPFEHPGLAEPRTKEEWRVYLASEPPIKPDKLPLEMYEQLSAKEKALHNRARFAHHSALVIVRNAQMDAIHHQIRRRMLTNARQPAGARRGIVLDGPATLGKSTLVKMFAADFEHELRRDFPERFERSYRVENHLVDYTPVVYINIPSQATPKDLSIALADYMGMAYRAGATKSAITNRVLTDLRLCGVELVIIDDAHFMNLSLKEGKVVNDHLKYIANHTAATFVYTGVDLMHSGLFLEGTGGTRVTQTSGRNTLLHLRPFSVETKPDKADWVSVIASMEAALVLYRHVPGTLKRAWKYLYERTNGNISSLAELIRESATEAVMTGAEAITRKLMEGIVINENAQTAYDRSEHEEPENPSTEAGSDEGEPAAG
ncbi:TniB family NTP-binding protein [Kitasatospora sp. NPDC094011]|uniref:TniB family NTP-binding protein n=1 Tax=Kitasatospora sp. NPDC094011 TaxID=3364090 RepID=UPI0038097A0F